MHIDISGKHLELTPPLEEYAREKFGMLEKLLERLDDGSTSLATSGAVTLHVTLERTTSHHHKGEVYRASVNLHVPHETLRAEESHKDVRAAIDIVKEEIERQVRKYKTRRLHAR